MKGHDEQAGLRVVRALLLGLLVIFLGVVAALFVARRGDVAPRPGGGDRDRVQGILDRISAGEGFDYEVTEGDQRLFRITAERVVASRDEVYELEGVVIETEQEDGTTYRIESERARYSERGREKLTTLEGNAVARSSTGAEISSTGFELRRGGRLVSSMADVEFRLGGRLIGSARRFDAYLDKDRYQFAGTVRIDSIGPAPHMTLKCQRLVYEEAERRIIADGGVVLGRDGDELRANRVSALLAENGKTIEFVNARWSVTGRHLLGDDIGSTIEFTADQVALQYDSATGLPLRAQFQVDPGGEVVLETGDDTGLARRIVAPFVAADFVAGNLHRAEADEPVKIREYLRFSPRAVLLDACAKTATAEFAANGQVTRLDLVDLVTLHKPQLQVTGHNLEYLEAEDVITARGSPAEVHAVRGRLTAPRISYRAGVGRLEASDGVRAELVRGSGFEMLRDRDDRAEPVRVTSEGAVWRTARREFEFAGTVRAWQGGDFVVADALRGEEGGRVLVADGSVKTVVATRTDGALQDGAPDAQPIEVTAGKLFYRRAERVIRYTDSPVARQAGRVVRCADMRLYLSPSSDLDKLVCEGSVSIEDPAASRSVRGARAEYRPAESIVEVTGQPAVLRDPGGNEVRGPVVVYDLERGTARVSTARPVPGVEESGS